MSSTCYVIHFVLLREYSNLTAATWGKNKERVWSIVEVCLWLPCHSFRAGEMINVMAHLHKQSLQTEALFIKQHALVPFDIHSEIFIDRKHTKLFSNLTLLVYGYHRMICHCAFTVRGIHQRRGREKSMKVIEVCTRP
jgi:hypothetical protein